MHSKLKQFIAALLTLFMAAQPLATAGTAADLAGSLQGRPEPALLDNEPFVPAPSPQPAPVIQPAPTPPDDLTAPLGSFLVRQVRLTGNHAISSETLRPLLTPYEGREITFVDLHKLRRELSRFYLERGYINSGAIIPDQEVSNGILEMQIIEGSVDQLQLHGNQLLTTSFLADRIALATAPPLNILDLGERLQLLQRLPTIHTLRSELIPGDQPGKASLDVRVTENPRHHGWMEFSNARSPSIGDWTMDVGYINDSLTGHADRLAFSLSGALGLVGGEVQYSLPINRYDTRLSLAYTQDDSKVVEGVFDDLDVRANSHSSRLTLSHPLIDRLDRHVELALGAESRYSLTRLKKQPQPFSDDPEDDGYSRLQLLHLELDGLFYADQQLLALRSALSMGRNTDSNRSDQPFLAWLGQLQWVSRSDDGNGEWLLRSELQLSDRKLPVSERYSLGGIHNVRGYRTNQLVRDAAAFLSLEYRAPFSFSRSNSRSFLRWAVFGDIARSWNKGSSEKDKLASIGVGLLWSPSDKVEGRLYLAHALEPVDDPTDPGLQDHGLYFSLKVSPF